MAFLFDDYNTLSNFGMLPEAPRYVVENLRPKFALRPYQAEAFARFVHFYERDQRPNKQRRPYHLLYNMATGSGKTNIMAGLVLYLYAQGYRDFLFFVSSDAVIRKTKDNFLNDRSSKYVFNERLMFDGRRVTVKEVQSFDESDPQNINIKFTTIQLLHSDMTNAKENSVSLEDFQNRKIVLLADEADAFNVATRNENTLDGNWENTIQSIHRQSTDNILLEFTATMDLETPQIEAKYADKAIFKYELKEFRRDGYSKEIELMKVAADQKNRVMHALILNLYRQVLAANHGINLKPVILFKAKRTIAESELNKKRFHQWIDLLSDEDIDCIRNGSGVDGIIKTAFAYFDRMGITTSDIVRRTRENFREENCISANNDAEKERNQMLLNSLEDEDNPIRAVFAVNKLDRGWDVLNLFDIVRMYDDRNEENKGKIGKTTRAEAQLIGRGARYFPFRIEEGQPLYMRKYDNDLNNELRILETLYYHIMEDSRYVSEIKKALHEAGIGDDKTVRKTLRLKDSFKQTKFFREARVVYNLKVPKQYDKVTSLADLSVRKKNYAYRLDELKSSTILAFGEVSDPTVVSEGRDVPLRAIPLHVIRYALTTVPFFRFNNLKRYCPNLLSYKEFISADEYLGSLEITIQGSKERLSRLTNHDYLRAIQGLLSNIEQEIKANKTDYEGSPFISKYLRDVFGTKEVPVPKDDEERMRGQEDELAEKDWYAYNANYGTSEERAFISLFARRYENFTKKYEDIYVIRNEKVVKIIDKQGRTFEPDFLLYLRDRNCGHAVYQIFIEPKGSHLVGKDKWKEDFLKEIQNSGLSLKIDTDNYHITGIPFYNEGNENEFKEQLENLLLA
ncbi:MAG: DEAD/DEAH box helicase family protein [Prevotella sp.]|nr:DEAD/DEAH box helicase family protein [Prevotella sp.]